MIQVWKLLISDYSHISQGQSQSNYINWKEFYGTSYTARGQLKSGATGWPVNKRRSRLLQQQYAGAAHAEHTTCHLPFRSN